MAENNYNRRPGGMRGHGGRMMPGEKAKDFKGSAKKLLSYLKNYRIAIGIVMIFAVASTVFNVVGPKILGKATTALFEGIQNKFSGTGGIDFKKVGTILLWVLALYLISAVCSFIQGFIMSSISQKVSYKLREDMISKINRLPMKYFDSKTHGEILSRITNDVDTLGQGLNQSITQLITSATTIIGVVIMMLTISPLMTLITFLILPLSLVFIGFITKRSQKYFRMQQNSLGNVNGQVEEVFSGHLIVKAFNREEASLESFNKDNDELYNSAWKSQFLSGLMMPIMVFIGNLGYVAIAIVGGVLAAKGTIKVGDIQSFIQYVRSFTQPISQMASVFNMLQSTMAASERVFEFLEEEEEEQIGTAKEKLSAKNITGQVTFDHVKFGYTDDKTIISDFSMEVKPGQKIAIVGPTGAGKTTIVKLLMRFYDLKGGRILIDGHDIKEYDRSELRECFGMVLQDTWLYKGSIMENIRYGKLDATDEEVIEAAKAAHANRFIMTLPGGYDMELNEEASNVSAGQKQLLTIARAILANNKIMILDEATSSVDTRTEERIQKAMDNLTSGRTSFIIAHRLSTIKNADIILVMKDGDIIEKGNHESLMAQDGFYASLYNSQFEAVG